MSTPKKSFISSEFRYGKILSFPDDLIGQSIEFYGEWAQKEIDFLSYFISHGQCVVDIGSFIGTHTLAFSNMVGDKGKVISYEANPACYNLLDKNINLNECKNVQSFNVGLSDTKKMIRINIPKKIKGNFGSLSLKNREAKKNGTQIALNTLDSFNLKDCRLLKIDVEGMEWNVLKGASRTINKTKPYIYFECNNATDAWPAIEYLKNINYKTYAYSFTAFNKDNYRKKEINNFLQNSEIGILGVPAKLLKNDFLDIKINHLKHLNLIEINNLEDLIPVLLSKLQYEEEFLPKNLSSKKLNLEINAIKKCRSMRITAPVRSFFNLLRKIKASLLFFRVALVFLAKNIIPFNFKYLFLRIKSRFFTKRKSELIVIDPILKGVENKFIYNDVIDIIVPVYNGLDLLKRLFNAIEKHTDLPYRLIIVNDKSTDPKIVGFLDKKQKTNKRFILINNIKNLGFIGSVNKAFKLVKSDFFVILNSDTEVPEKWLSRMLRPFFLDTKLGSVTPFSNSATLCSFPESFKDNELYQGLSLSKIDEAFRRLPLINPLLKIPTGVGFCMAFRSDLVNKIGFFDQIYGKGYCEENDWCLRATNYGYHHALVNNLFVYHEHGGSFSSDEKNKLIRKNFKFLLSRYPEYQSLIHNFVNDDPIRYLRNIVEFILFKSQQTILIIDHDIGGGANDYRNESIQKFLDQNKKVVLFTDNANSGLTHLTFYSNKQIQVTNLKNMSLFKNIFNLFSIDEVIYNNSVNFKNTLNFLNEILNLKKVYKFKITTLIHDFYPICPSYTLINKDGKYCELPKIDVCQKCIGNLNPIYSGVVDNNRDIYKWRECWGNFLKSSEQIICFSNSSKEILLKVYPFAKNTLNVIPHLVHWAPIRVPLIQKSKLNIGVIGSLNYAKGASLINELVNYIEDKGLQIHVTLLGEITPIFFNAKINILGRYEKKDLPFLIEKNNLNMILMPSIWPETFSYVTSEIIKMDLPLVSFDIGAQAERVKEYKKGLTLPINIPIEVLLSSIMTFHKKINIIR